MLGLRAKEVKAEALTSGLRIVLTADKTIKKEGYQITEEDHILLLKAADEVGVLYGVFHILRQIAQELSLAGYEMLCNPDHPFRMVNHWDNMDGSIERGYSGKSFFFKDAEILINQRTADYARMMASIGVNAVVINNVNVIEEASWLITDRYLETLSAMAELFSGYGMKLFLSIDFAAAMNRFHRCWAVYEIPTRY